MQNFISLKDYDASIHREILDSLLRQGTSDYDPQIIEICEDRAISEMKATSIKNMIARQFFHRLEKRDILSS